MFDTFDIEASSVMTLLGKLLPRVGGAETRTFRAAVADVLGPRRAPCPACDKGTLVPSTTDLGARICEACGASFPLEVLRQTIVADDETVARVAAASRREALIAFLAADGVAIGSAIWAVVAGGLPTLVGGTMLALLLLAFAATAHYRAWQVEHRRLFEARPPIGAWLRAETRGD